MGDADRFEKMLEALRAAVPALHQAGIPFLLGGSMAAWAYGGPEPVKDIDLMVREQDAERTLQVLSDAGFRSERPPEEWLLKAWWGDVLVDIIFAPRGLPIDDEVLARGQERSLCALRVPVMALEDVLTTKLRSLDEHQLDLAYLLQIVRAIREQVDWDEVRRRTDDWPYAAAFMTLIERLGVADPHQGPQRPPDRMHAIERPAGSAGNAERAARPAGSAERSRARNGQHAGGPVPGGRVPDRTRG